MKIRLGYACITNTLNITSSSTYPYSRFIKEKDYNKLNDIIISNLTDLKEILLYNSKNNIHFFRISSELIPLATKNDVVFDYIDSFKSYYKDIHGLIKNMRVDFHPSQFCVLNSTRKEVVKNSIDILKYHYKLLKVIGVKNKIMILHIGSSILGKKNSIRRFINNYNKLPNYLKKCIVIENDDKVFTVSDCILISRELNIPIVLDYHHYKYNNEDELSEHLVEILNSWAITPKMHFSSPKNKKEKRSHNDYINSEDFINFITLLKPYNIDIDIMIEAKAKDEALFRLVRELKYKTNYNFIDETTFIV